MYHVLCVREDGDDQTVDGSGEGEEVCIYISTAAKHFEISLVQLSTYFSFPCLDAGPASELCHDCTLNRIRTYRVLSSPKDFSVSPRPGVWEQVDEANHTSIASYPHIKSGVSKIRSSSATTI